MAEINQREIAEDWLKITIENWKSELTRLKIGNTQALFKSFHGSVIGGAGNDTLKIALAYAWYGQMVDMGVGRGTKNGDQDGNVLARRILGKDASKMRQPKTWYSKGKKGIGYQMNKLAELIGGVHASIAVEKIAAQIQTDQSINFK